MAVRRSILMTFILLATMYPLLFGQGSVRAVAATLQQTGRTTRGGRVPPPQRRVPLAAVPGEKTVVRGDLMIRKVDAPIEDTQLASDEYIVARWAKTEQNVLPLAVPNGKAWSAGFGFIGINREGQEIRFRPVIEAASGLALTGEGNNFQGRIYVGLRDNENPAATYRLPQPVSLLVSGQAEEFTPRQLSIDHTNLPFAEVTIGSQNPPDSMDLILIAAGTSERATISLPVLRPHLEVVPSRSRIQGLGLETSTVGVRVVGLPNPAGRIVSLTSNFGSLEPAQVSLDAQGFGTTTVRSVSFGEDAITAVSPPLAPAMAPIYFALPVAFLLASAIGGLLGAGLARIQNAKKAMDVRTVLIRGVVTGIIMVALYGIGVNILPIRPTAMAGEALAFGVAAIGAFVGLRVK